MQIARFTSELMSLDSTVRPPASIAYYIHPLSSRLRAAFEIQRGDRILSPVPHGANS